MGDFVSTRGSREPAGAEAAACGATGTDGAKPAGPRGSAVLGRRLPLAFARALTAPAVNCTVCRAWANGSAGGGAAAAKAAAAPPFLRGALGALQHTSGEFNTSAGVDGGGAGGRKPRRDRGMPGSNTGSGSLCS